MHNNKGFNGAKPAQPGLHFAPAQGEDTMATLPDMLRAEVARCQNLADTYAQLGTAGEIGRAHV
jgi:hypothetical protein